MASPTACRLRVRGIVQGVGFRPHVWRMANALGLSGWVRNDAEGVEIALAGEEAALARFVERIKREAPPLARIDSVESRATNESVEPGFHILESSSGDVRTNIGPDAAVCSECLAEIFDPGHRRYRYAFTTCTHCGPRYTIARSLPYDRKNTSLAPFPLCAPCAAEYADPANRRFHAEATCCANCGPRLSLRAIDGSTMAGDPVSETLRLLRLGKIVAIKGLGGFHLACDARNAAAVAALRERKGREAKPFAVMAVSASVVVPYANPSESDLVALHAPAAPVVLLEQTARCSVDLPGIAPGVGTLGLMLPNTPLQWVLFHQAAGRPQGTAWMTEAPPDLLLVMTSANPQGEPLVIDDEDALLRLRGIADAVLGHDRAIVARADDSVIRGGDGGNAGHRGGVFIRRGRGFTPQAIRLPHAGPSVIAFGGWFKNTICLTRGDEAFVSTHIGDLDHGAACGFLDETVARMLDLTGIEPERVAHDAHPDFYSTQAALRFADRFGLPTQPVFHHHAHLAAVAAEHGLTGPILGLALDGVGLGPDGSAWGGELLRVDGADCRRLGHLKPLPMPGGDKAAREPWRMAAAILWQLSRGAEIETRFARQPGAGVIRQMLDRRLNCPATSSAGRLFDAAAGLLGIVPVAQFEAQAAMQLEALAKIYGPIDALNGGWTVTDGVLDLSPLLTALADETDAARGAALFHQTLAAALANWVQPALQAASAQENCKLLAGGGGCFLNRQLTQSLRQELDKQGIELREAQHVPPGDGGLSLGQAWIAMQTGRQ